MGKDKKLKKLTIDRRKWGRGNTGGSLLNKNGLKCCLGFACTALGFKNRDILDEGIPSDLVSTYTKEKARSKSVEKSRAKKLDWLVEENGSGKFRASSAVNQLVGINDDSLTSDNYKEAEITRIFKENGVKVKFIN